MKLMLNTPLLGAKNIPTTAPVKTLRLYIEDGNYATLEFYREEIFSYVVYRFDRHNSNPHLKTAAEYFHNKALIISQDHMEKILELIP